MRRDHPVHPEERRAEVGLDRPRDAGLGQGEDGVRRAAESVPRRIAEVDVGELQPALGDERLERGARIEALARFRGGLGRGEDQPLDQPPLGLHELGVPLVVEPAQRRLVRGQGRGHILRQQRGIGDPLRLGGGEIGRMRLIPGLKLGIGRCGQRLGQIGLGHAQQPEAPPLGDIGVERIHHLGRGDEAAAHRALQERARHVLAQAGLELALGEVVLAQHEPVGLAVELAGGAVEGVRAGDLARHARVAHRQADPVGLVRERGLGDEPATHLLVEAEGLGHLHRDRLVDLRAERPHLLLERAGIGPGGDVAVAHAADRAEAAAEIGHAEAAEAHGHQPDEAPEDELRALLLRLVVLDRRQFRHGILPVWAVATV